jgi:hypothetical protein
MDFDIAGNRAMAGQKDFASGKANFACLKISVGIGNA